MDTTKQQAIAWITTDKIGWHHKYAVLRTKIVSDMDSYFQEMTLCIIVVFATVMNNIVFVLHRKSVSDFTSSFST